MINLNRITKTYYTIDEQIHALKDVTLSFSTHNFASLVGPSGCGKTTLLNIIGGLDQPTSGTLEVSGQSTAHFSDNDFNIYRNQKIGFVFQNYYLIPHLSIVENVALPLILSGTEQQEALKKSKTLLTELGLESKINKKPNELSGGQQQRAAIARALIHEPDIILADEPTGSLDNIAALEIMKLLKEISKDRLVIMVTHNLELATTYSDRIIEMKNGSISKDTHNSVNAESSTYITDKSTTKMSVKTAFKLSILNLLKRKYRTLLTILAAGISIIGLSLVLSVSFGFNRYIDLKKIETLNAFPVRVERISFVVPLLDDNYRPNLDVFPQNDTIHLRNIQYEFQTINTLTPDYYDYVQSLDSSLYDYVHYDYRVNSNFIAKQDGTLLDPSAYLRVSEVNKKYIETYFDILYGVPPEDNEFGVIIVLDRYNRLSKDIAQAFGFDGNDDITFADLLNIELRWVSNTLMYQFDGTNYTKRQLSNIYEQEDAITIPIQTIIRINDDFEIDFLKTGLYYTKGMQDLILEDSLQSEIVIAQLTTNQNVIDGSSLSSAQKETALRNLGHATYPLAYSIYSNTFEDKDAIMSYLRNYNLQVSMSEAIEPLDVAGIGLSTMRIAIDSTTWILLVFAILSLLISNLMIGIMTYTSVIERTKEIGLLRSIGARKNDVKNIFYSETITIGFISGILGVLIVYAILPLVNMLLYELTTIRDIGYLPLLYACIVIVLNTLLTGLAGFIPARLASQKDPIIALRNE